jgi:endonuclease/exonuclease/phosphatase family metal-dependent hydrolase
MSTSRWKYLAAMGLLIASACTSALDKPPSEADLARGSFAPAVDVHADSLVVAAYNIKFGEQVELAIQELGDHPMLAAADVLLLQEMHPEGCEAIARRRGYDFVYYPASVHPQHDRPFGNAVLARARLVDQGFVILPKAGLVSGTRRIAVHADLEIGSRRLRAVSVHTSTVILEQRQRLRQAQTILDSLSAVAGPMVIGGDFNTGSPDDVLQFRSLMRRAGFRQVHLPGDATIRKSWPRMAGVSFVLDHFFYRGLQVRRSGVVEAARASDHYPIWVVFEWNEEFRS